MKIKPVFAIITVFALAAFAMGCESDSKSTSSKDSSKSTTEESTDAQTETVVDGKKQWDSAPPMTIDKGGKYHVKMKTNKGDFTIELLPKEGPNAANNFLFLVKEGFFKNIPVHRVIKGFMVQTGDPTGTGTGGPGYSIEDDEVSLPYERGIVAMANAGPDTGGSQFFVMHQDYDLPPSYSIFGKVVDGIETIDAIANAKTVPGDNGENSTPAEKITLESATLVEG